MKTPVSTVAPGQTVKYHGEPCIVLEHRAEGTLLMVAAQIKYTFGPSNNFAASPLRSHLNVNYLEALTENHPDEVISRTVDLTALNGSKQYGTCDCKMAPLTLDEIRKYHAILPKPETWDWSVTPWSTPNVDEDDTWVLGLLSNGDIVNDRCTSTYGARPAFLLPPDYAVETEDNPLEKYSTEALVEELFHRLKS